MKISRDWATPLTLASFGLMAVTGVLMFFHLDRGLNKVAHEWLGWVMVGGVALHGTANWPALRRHLQDSTRGRAIAAAGLLVLAGSFVTLPGGRQERGSPPQLAIRALTQAPLSQVAPLTGRSVAQLRAELAAAGIEVASPDDSVASATGDSRERTGRALGVMFGGH